MAGILELTKPELTKSEVLYGISWEVYEEILEENWNKNSPRFTYDSGILEVEMPNSLGHEEDSRNLAALFEEIAVELEIDFRRVGSTTYKKQGIHKGFEPDSGFYIQSINLIEAKTDLDFENDPPPDLTIEINRTSSSVPRMPIFAAFGVPEVWRFDGTEVRFYFLEEGVYLETKTSLTLPILSSEKATQLLNDSKKMKSTTWIRSIRDWVKMKK